MNQASLFRPTNRISLPPMRSWQQRTDAAIRAAIREGHKRIVVQSPTGAGKTLLAAHLFSGAINKGTRPMFTVPDITLVDQTVKSFERVGIHDIGVMQGQHERTDGEAQVQVASVQTLVRRPRPDIHFIVADEVHVQFQMFYDLIESEAWRNTIVIGLSATPWAKGMGHHWTKLIIGATIQELIAEGVLCGFNGYGPDEEVDRSKIKVTAGEFNEGASSMAMQEARIVGDVVKTWQERWGQDRTFMFCVDRKHAQTQRDAFINAGVPWGYIDGTMDRDQRRVVFEQFRASSIKGIASVGCLIRGVDEDVRCIVDCQPTKSEMNHVQKIGRGLRIAQGKTGLLILDHAGNNAALGTVTDIFHDHLDTSKPGEKAKPFENEKPKPKPKVCGKCHAIIAAHLFKCPYCAEPLPRATKVQHRDGELIEFGAEGSKKTKAPVADKQRWYSELLGLAIERNRKEGWAAWRYKEKFGVWPRGLEKVPATASQEIRNFDHSRRIAYAKSKQRG